MWDFLQHNWELFAGFITGGGMLSFLTAKWTKLSAQANAMKEWQGVYQETINDLREDKRIMKDDIRELHAIVEQNTKDIEELMKHECVVLDCALRKRKMKIVPKKYE